MKYFAFAVVWRSKGSGWLNRLQVSNTNTTPHGFGFVCPLSLSLKENEYTVRTCTFACTYFVLVNYFKPSVHLGEKMAAFWKIFGDAVGCPWVCWEFFSLNYDTESCNHFVSWTNYFDFTCERISGYELNDHPNRLMTSQTDVLKRRYQGGAFFNCK